jgi:hypothetical protein
MTHVFPHVKTQAPHFHTSGNRRPVPLAKAPAHPGGGFACCTLIKRPTAYPQRYRYDKLGNSEQLRHTAANAADSFTRSFDYGSGATNYK